MVHEENKREQAGDSRMFNCLHCGKLTFVCHRCDRGQIYCGSQCSSAGRRTSLHRLRRQYAKSERGRQATRMQQARCRAVLLSKTKRVRKPSKSSNRPVNKVVSVDCPEPLPRQVHIAPSVQRRADAPGAVSLKTLTEFQTSDVVIGTECTLCHQKVSWLQRSQFLWDLQTKKPSRTHMNKWDSDP